MTVTVWEPYSRVGASLLGRIAQWPFCVYFADHTVLYKKLHKHDAVWSDM